MARRYEISLILDAQLSEEDIDGAIERCEGFLTGEGARIVDVHRMGPRKLAYELKKHQRGFYAFIRFDAESGMLPELDRRCRLEESVLRHMVLVSEDGAEEAADEADEADAAVEADDAVEAQADAPETSEKDAPEAGESSHE